MSRSYSTILSVLFIIAIAYLFLFSIDLLIESFKQIGSETARSILSITDNAFISLFTGLLITAIIQSSSTTTSMIVAIVATGSMSFENAIPMIMGANIGTTLTSTLVSMSFITKKNEFQKAFSAGILHDFFNIAVVIILFPLEYFFQLLSKSAHKLSVILNSSFKSFQPSWEINLEFTSRLTSFFYDLISNPIITLILAGVLLFISIKIISKQVSNTLINRNANQLENLIFKNSWKSFGLGALLTSGVQSSSITTSLVVPVAASGTISLNKLFPFIIGSNIGTTITALIAAFFISADAITIAGMHVLFNFFGFLIFMFIPKLKTLTLGLAEKFGELTRQYRLFSLYYILLVFFLIPFLLIYLSN